MPTVRQQKVVEKLSENVGKPLGQIMREAGYSKSTSETPQRLTNTKGFQELLEEYFPDDFLNEKLKEDIQEKKGERLGELTLAYKLKGYLKNKGDSPEINFNNEFREAFLKAQEGATQEPSTTSE